MTMPSRMFATRLGGVDRLLEPLEDVLPADHDHRVDAVLEQRGERLAHDAVALVLEPVDLDRVVRDVARSRAAAASPGRSGARRLQQHVGQLLRLLHRRLDLVEAEEVGDLLDVVDDVVERGGQLVDVLAVDRGDERLVEPPDDVVRDPVAVLLADQDVAGQLAALGVVREQPLEQLGRAQDVAAGLLEEVEELAVAAGGENVRQAHAAGRYQSIHLEPGKLHAPCR